ncbi:MAG: nitronate monooxygenase [Acidimicrobiia bacterium]
MSERAITTRFTERFGLRAPIIQTGMGWVSGPRLTAATAEAGALGFLAAATMSVEELKAAADEVRSRTVRPFGINLVPSVPDAAERVAVAVAHSLPAVSFAAAPSQALVDQCRAANIATICTVGAPRHAEKVAAMGVDAVIAQGGEGGGHTGSIATSLLLPAVVDAVGTDLLVIGAGGYFDGRGLAAALTYGADAIAMGTRFLLTQESRVPDEVKKAYLAAKLTDTIVTLALDGAPQRVIRTEAVTRLEKGGSFRRLPAALKSAAAFKEATGMGWAELAKSGWAMRKEQPMEQVVMAAVAPMLTKATMVDGDLEAGIMPTGQVVGDITEIPTVADLIERILEEAHTAIERLKGLA